MRGSTGIFIGVSVRSVYIIEGNTGEYSDRTNWLVKAFLNRENATNFKFFLEKKLSELKLDEGFSYNWEERDRASTEMKKYDPSFCCDYTGTHYCILTVELDDGDDIY